MTKTVYLFECGCVMVILQDGDKIQVTDDESRCDQRDQIERLRDAGILPAKDVQPNRKRD